jgi:hypothetical protein
VNEAWREGAPADPWAALAVILGEGFA